MATFTVALLGTWPDEDEWRLTVECEVSEILREKCGDRLTINFIEPTPTSQVPFFPHAIGHAVVEDLVLAQYSMLAHKADLVVIVDEGMIEDWKGRLLDRLDDQVGALIVWIPVLSEERKEDLPDQSGYKPGVVVGTGAISKLAAMIVFLCLQGETDL